MGENEKIQYRVKEYNGKFLIQGLGVEHEVVPTMFGLSHKLVSNEKWMLVDYWGKPINFGVGCEPLKSLEAANKRIKEMIEGVKYHYYEQDKE